MTDSALLERPERLPATAGTSWRQPAELRPGDVVVIEDRQPSSEGFVHVVAKVRKLRGGWVRVWFDVWYRDERYRSPATPWRDYGWDRLYEPVRRLVGHRRDCGCDLCVERAMDVPMVEVVSR